MVQYSMSDKFDILLDTIEAKQSEIRYLTAVLALWRHAAKAGYTEDEVEAFTFRARFLSREDRKTLGRPLHGDYPNPTHHNCVRLRDGSLKEIPLYPRPRIDP